MAATRVRRASCVALVAALAAAPFDSPAGATTALEGVLTIVWADPQPGSPGGATRYTLTLPDGRRMALRLSRLESVAVQHFGRRVVVSGRHVPGAAGQAFDVEALAGVRAGRAPLAVVGTRKVLYLLVKYADDSAVPHPPSFYANLNNPDTPPAGEVFPTTVNGFFKKTSWNQFSWVGDVGGTGGVPATDWLTLPSGKSHYAPCGFGSVCADIGALTDDAMDLAVAAGIDVATYDNVNFVLSNDLDCCAWGGNFFYADKLYGGTWQPPPFQHTALYAHEMGHSIGLPHSGWVYYSYDSPWDLMSNNTAANAVPCGTYSSVNAGEVRTLQCTEPGDGYSAPHKDELGWIPGANLSVFEASAPGATVTLEAGTLPLGSAAKMIKVCSPSWPCTGPTARYLTVEARVKGLGAASQYDNAIPADGVILHAFRRDRPSIGAGDPCYFNSQSGWALPVDATPGDWNGAPVCNSGGRVWPEYALGNAQWLPGQTYLDPDSGRSIAVQSKTGSSYVIAVSNAPPTPTPTPTPTATPTPTPTPGACSGFEGDAAPRPNGNGALTTSDWVQVGRFAAALDTPACGCELRRADCAPAPCGNGTVSTSDWVQAGRYAAALDIPVAACGPTSGQCASAAAVMTADAAGSAAPPAGAARVRLRRVAGARGETVTVTLPRGMPVGGFGFSLEFDATALAFEGARHGRTAEGRIHLVVNERSKAQGRIGLVLIAIPGEALPAEDLLHLRFTRRDPRRSGRIELADTPVPREVADTSGRRLGAGVELSRLP